MYTFIHSLTTAVLRLRPVVFDPIIGISIPRSIFRREEQLESSLLGNSQLVLASASVPVTAGHRASSGQLILAYCW